ncbi:class I SAM-dependent methyltransferase [Enterococcus raffinosus]|uniref:class I SAM-dependent methyltransferase n=1 Tax=Enterococcus raffinosus TaxID=71452 RepID=UPI001C129495|nr:class I SAM-dependent methyltransferase [Enterococcus raffinosus]MBU5363469.1 class I SAM-dependent methyltransferase [Enterococcus raffinosus]
MSHHAHEHHNLDNEENFKRMVAALDGEERKQQLPAEAIIGYLPELAGKTIFDGGAGTGFLTLPLAKQAEKVIAFDQSKKMLELIHERAKAQQLTNITSMSGDIKAIVLPDSSMDIAIVCMMIHEVHPFEDALKELARIIKPDGQLVILEFESETTQANGGHRIPSQVMKRSLEKLQLPIIQQLIPAEGMYLFVVGKK